MSIFRVPEFLNGLVHELRNFDFETERVEFKQDNTDPKMIGEYISALSNSAALNSIQPENRIFSCSGFNVNRGQSRLTISSGFWLIVLMKLMQASNKAPMVG